MLSRMEITRKAGALFVFANNNNIKIVVSSCMPKDLIELKLVRLCLKYIHLL